MRYLIPGSDGYWISDDYQISTFDRQQIDFKKEGEKLKIRLFGKDVLRTSEWLYCFARLRAVDSFDLDNVDFVKVIDSRNMFPWIITFKNPRYYRNTDCRIVPGFPAVAINCDGTRAINTLLGLNYKTIVGSTGYAYITNVYDFIRNRSFPLSIYRLVALTWVKNDNPALCNVVNHLDGNKLNCDYRNLEWTTSLGNMLHAVEHGLTKTAKKCRLHNIKTDEILEFPSLEQANVFLGMRPKEIVNFKQRRANIVYNGKYEVRMEGDDRPWSYTKNTVNVEPSRYIYHITDNGETLTYNGTRSVIKKYKLWNLPSNSAKQVLQVLKEQYPDIKVECIDQYETRPIQVRNIETGEVREFRKVKDAVNEIGFCKTMLLYGMKYDGRKVISDKYVVRRKTSNPWPKDLMEVKNEPMGVKITDKSTRETFTFDSLKEAERTMKCSRTKLKRMMKFPKMKDKFEVVNQCPTIG